MCVCVIAVGLTAYDWNSDDEPPADKPMDVSVVAFQGNGVLKRILHPGQVPVFYSDIVTSDSLLYVYKRLAFMS